MSSDSIRPGPGLSPSQRIGDIARSVLMANKPDNWILSESAGDDFGFDFQVTAFSPGGEGAQCAFNIQLKGTTQASARVHDGKILSYPFDSTTLNLWYRSGFAVFVVIVDLIDTQDIKKATAHYSLANYALEEILPALPSDQKTVRLHVPVEQVIHQGLDVLPFVLRYLDEIAEARQLARDRRRAGGTVTPDGSLVSPSDCAASVRIGSSLPTDDLEDRIGRCPRANELRSALLAFRQGDYDFVLTVCPDVTEDYRSAEPAEAAISSYLRSMAFSALGDSRRSAELAELAAKLQPDCDDFVGAAMQARLEAIALDAGGADARRALLSSLEAYQGVAVSGVKAKLLALMGDFEAARNILKPFAADKAVATSIVISILERAWERALAEVTEARTLKTLKPRQRLLVDIFESRALFELALQAVAKPATGDLIIPFSGLPEIDYDRLRLAFASSRQAMLAAQRLNWPTDITYILDVFPTSAMLLGYGDEAMTLIGALGVVRPSVAAVREIASKMAVQLEQPNIALQLSELAAGSPKFEHEDCILAVAAVKAGQIHRALTYITADLLADPSAKDVYLTALIVVGMAAQSVLRQDLVEKIRERLDQEGEPRHLRAILDAGLLVQQSLLRRNQAMEQLHNYWLQNGKPATVGYHILANTDARSESEAQLFVEVAQALEEENSLNSEQLADFGQALLTTNRIDDAIAKLKSAANRFRDDPKIKSILGIALELGGRSPEAFEIIEDLLGKGLASETARRYFVQIAARIGFFDKAEQQVRAAYANARHREQKLSLLNTLFQLLLAESNRPEEVEQVAWEYGRLANEADEREEGIFLQEYLVATMREGLTVPQDRAAEFHRRLETYSERFPNSKYLWRAELPKDGPPEAMLSALKEAVGLTDEVIAEADAIERKMDRGALQVPFSWRPRRFLRNVPNVFMLWEIRKGAPHERAALHFQSSVSGYERRLPDSPVECEAVISLTSLLLLDEISLLGFVLDTFPRLVIARSTLIALQEARHAVTSGWGHDRATRIISELQARFLKITHPPYSSQAEEMGAEWYPEERRAMEQPGAVYFSDDIVETYLVCEQDRQSISTVDFLTWADEKAGLLSASRVADAIGQIARLKVGAITVAQRYLIAAIPNDLRNAMTQTQAEVAWKEAITLRSILDAVWDHYRPFQNLRGHLAANVAYLLNTKLVTDEALVPLWIRWLQTVRFQDKPDLSPTTKMGLAFLLILEQVDADVEIVKCLWRSFWMALQRGLGNELKDSEDRTAIRLIADLLGIRRATKGQEIESLFDKAKIGLEEGTERESWFNTGYVESVARREIANLARK